ncbi:MAG: lycopene beta-cyclase [Cognaticolwellia sp.]|jgi:lycopene beta-cyclase
MPTTIHDLLVLGAGPAGLALAQAASAQGHKVAVLSPKPHRPWEQMLCAWLDELPAGTPTQATWAQALVHLGEAQSRSIERPYALLDNEALQAQLSQGLEIHDGRAEQVTHSDDFSQVNELRARVLVDATGHKPAVLQVPSTPPVGWQTAFGATLVGEHGLPIDRAVFMDWRTADDSEAPALPTFLYALPLGPDRLFVEETSLIAGQAPTMESLKSKLLLRLDGMGLRGDLTSPERCLFPMGGALPSIQRVVPFGASAGMVHPATGYSVGRSLRSATGVAKALDPSLDPVAASAKLWSAVWTPSARRARVLHMMGARIIENLDTYQTRAFFGAFFDLPVPVWSRYLDSESSPVWPMLKLFGSAEAPVRRQILSSTLSQGIA